MIDLIQKNREDFARLLNEIQITSDKGIDVSFTKAIENIVELTIASQQSGGKVLWIGNGGSAAIASHMVTDFLKNAGVPAMAFNDGSLLTCLSNDLGYESVFTKPISMLAKASDVLFAISSSGRSQSIVDAVSVAKKMGLTVVTLSGFDVDNPLRKMGNLNFYVPSHHYGHVEDIHQSIGHCLIDMIIQKK